MKAILREQTYKNTHKNILLYWIIPSAISLLKQSKQTSLGCGINMQKTREEKKKKKKQLKDEVLIISSEYDDKSRKFG